MRSVLKTKQLFASGELKINISKG